MTSTAMESAELVKRLEAALPAYGSPDAEYVELVLGSFLALVSAARILGPSGPQPMIQVRYQFWMRELARADHLAATFAAAATLRMTLWR
jgi:hypothetical protein